MIRAVNRLADRLADRSLANTRSRVDDPPRARRVFRRDVAITIVVLLSLFGEDMLPQPWALLCGVVVAAAIGAWSLPTWRRASAYEDGYLRGRMQLFGSLREAGQRGMSLDEWLHAELARDAAIIGITLPVPSARDDDDCGGI